MPFTLTMPKLSPTMEEGTIAQWHKKEGERVEAGDLLFEVSTDKATVEYNALDEGWLRKIIVPQGQSATVNQPVAVMSEEEQENISNYTPEGVSLKTEPAKKTSDAEVKISEGVHSKQTTPHKRIMASPLAKKLAKERNIDLSSLQGTGPGKRIMSRDLEKKVSAPAGSYTIEKLSSIRKVIAQRLQEAKSTIPHFYVQQIFDAEPLIQLREQLKSVGQVVSINDLVVKACALALNKHPQVNTGFNAADNTLLRYNTVDIAVAVSLPEGLITPIVTKANEKSVQEISSEIRSLAKRAKENKLALHEFQGGSFTVSNLGMYGVSSFQAIINPPHSAILAVGGILDVPVIREGKVVPGKTMTVNLSADHRVIDGVLAAEFLITLKKLIENPISLILT